MRDLRPFARPSSKLADHLPWAGLVAPGVVLNKDGSFQRSLRYRGPDLDASTPAELVGASDRLNNVLRRLGSGWAIWAEARRRPSPDYPASSFDTPLAWLIDAERRMVFETAGQRFETDYHLTLAYLPPPERTRRLEGLLFEGGPTALGQSYGAYLERFIAETDELLALIEPLMSETAWLSDEETLGYLHDCISDRPMGRLAVPSTPVHLDALLPDAPLVGGLSPRLGRHHLRILSVRSFGSVSEPGLLDALNRLPVSYRWVTRFLPLDREAARREIEIVRKRWFSKRKGLMTLLREALFREEASLQDNDAANQALDADAALQELGEEAIAAGFATLTIVVAEPTEAEADAAIRLIRQPTDTLGLVTQVEAVNAVEAWLGGLPGEPYADVRRPIFLTPSLAHLLPASAVWAGAHSNAHLKGPPLLLAATDGATPFRLNLHVGDVGHTLVIGPTGSGKSVLLNLLAAQFLRYPKAQVIMLDKGRSARAMMLGLGGEVFDLCAEEGLGLQPLALIDQPAERAFAQDWLTGVLVHEGLSLTPDLKAELRRTLDLLADHPRSERTLSLFSALVQDRSVRSALAPFTHEGPHGSLLDADQEGLPQGRLLAFELEELLRRPQAAAAFLPVLFHRLECRFDGRPTLLVLDEAWLFLKHAVFAHQIEDWLKTLRKRNVAVVLASQEIADIERSTLASTLLEACATRIFLPNDRAREPRTRAFYEALGLNTRQIDLIATASPKRDYYVVSHLGSRLIDLGLTPAALAFAGAAGPEIQARIDLTLARRGREAFATAWLEASGLKPAAEALERFLAAQGTTPAPAIRYADLDAPDADAASRRSPRLPSPVNGHDIPALTESLSA